MNYIFWGYFFVLINFNITSGNSVIGLFPDFIGYILIYKGNQLLRSYSNRFVKIQPTVILLAILTAITYMLDILGVTAKNYYFNVFCMIILILIGIYAQYHVVHGILDIQRTQNIELNAETLLSTWKIAAVINILSLFFMATQIALLFLLLAMMANIIFLILLYQTKKLYERNTKE